MGRPREFDNQKVIERAMDTFWTHGYSGTTPAKLVEATGLGKSSLYNAFRSKRALFDLCLESYQEQIRDAALQLMSQPGDAIECIRGALYTIADNDVAQPQRRGCLIGNTIVELSGQDDDLATRLRRMQDESTSWFADRIRKGQIDGDIDAAKDPQALAEHLATTLTGLRIMAMTHDKATLHRIIDTALTALR